jgi:hypothetical protein
VPQATVTAAAAAGSQESRSTTPSQALRLAAGSLAACRRASEWLLAVTVSGKRVVGTAGPGNVTHVTGPSLHLEPWYPMISYMI